jgi:serine/threonine-protein kinase
MDLPMASDSSAPTTDDLMQLSVPTQRRIEAVCSRFEQQCRRGHRPPLAAMLESVAGPERSVLLRELLFLDIEYRVQRHERPERAEYLADLANDAAVIDEVFEAIGARPRPTETRAVADAAAGHRVAAGSPQPRPCRFELVEGPTPHLTAEIQRLLHSRLRIVVVLAGLAPLGLLVISLLADSDVYRFARWQTLELVALVLTMAGLAAWLWSRPLLSVVWLRRIELVAFGVPAVMSLQDQIVGYHLARIQAYASGSHQGDLAAIYGDARSMPWALLIFGYGVLIPNTWRRCAAVVIGLAGTAMLAEVASSLWHTTTAYLAAVLVELGLWLPVACAVAIYGSHRIGTLGREVFEARQLGQYRLKRLLASGGMGQVYLAEHQLLRRPCVVKVVRPDRSRDPTMLARFEREVHATARLSHWNTVEIYDYGHAEDGTFYYVMEYLPGWNLTELVDQFGPLPAGRVVYLVRQVCAALSEAHSAGLIHRDIKPSNIITCERGGRYDVIKVLDFGLVQPLALDSDRLTIDGAIAGTPEYMSPEQVGGKPPFDARSDIYSLGAVMHYLLTGRAPFVRETPMKVLAAHLYEAVPPLCGDGSAVSPDLDAVVRRCLQKDPAARFPDVTALESALEQCGVGEDWTAQSSARWWQANAPARLDAAPQ